MNFIYDNSNPNSWASKLRKKRFDFFMAELGKIEKKSLKILDVGGTQSFWQNMGFEDHPDIKIYLLNLEHQNTSGMSFISCKGDATNLSQYDDDFFDAVFSNSVIEHLYTWENQFKMAKEIRRVGVRYFVQTPNYWFPVEPHFVFLFFQYLPKKIRLWLILNFRLGHHPKYKKRESAIRAIEEIQLLSIKQMKKLFPDSTIYREKFIGLNKSIIV